MHRSVWRFYLLAIYLMAGVTALAYEVLWVRYLSSQFGISIYGVIITVAAFMLGLGLGSLFMVRYRHHISRPLLLFALLEVAIAVYALAFPAIMTFVSASMAMFSGGTGLTSWLLVEGTAALILLTLPAIAMGAGFPLVLAAAKEYRIGLAQVYAYNTLGGAIGCLIPLWLMPSYGWLISIQIVAATGLVVAVMAYFLSSRQGELKQLASQANAKPPLGMLMAYGVIGGAALMIEIGWTRLFGMILLRTEYVLAIILSIFLVGIGLGSYIAKRLSRPRLWLNLFPLVACCAGLGSLLAVPYLSRFIAEIEYASLFSALLIQGLALAVISLPVTLVIGAWLPLISKTVSSHTSSGAWLYGANSIGGAIGVILAGFVLIPWLGTTAVIVVAALTMFLFGMVWCDNKKLWFALIPVMPLLWLAWFFPAVSELLPSVQANSTDLYRYEDSIATTHVIQDEYGQRLLLSDLQRMDASTEATAVVLQKNQVRLPLILHPDAEEILLLGLGTGISASALLALPQKKVTAVELSQGAINAAQLWFTEANGNILEHIELVRDDSIRFLRHSEKYYDLIIGDVFHPDMVGRSRLLSRQQFERVYQRLGDGGVYVQWLALNQFDLEALQIILRTFKEEFDDSHLFVEGFRLAMVGTKQGLMTVENMLERYDQLADEQQDEISGKQGFWTWIGHYWGPIKVPPGLMEDDNLPQIEYYLPRVRYQARNNLELITRWLLTSRPGLEQAQSLLNIGQQEEFKRAYIATELGMRSWLAGFNQRPQEMQRLLRLAHQANPRDYWVSITLADKMFLSLPYALKRGINRRDALQQILVINQDHLQTLCALWQLEQEQGNEKRVEKYRNHYQLINPYGYKYQQKTLNKNCVSE